VGRARHQIRTLPTGKAIDHDPSGCVYPNDLDFAGDRKAAGYQLQVPEGTFYLWARSPGPDDVVFCPRLAERNVLVLPGTVCEAPGHFRISLTASHNMIDRALPAFKDR
jgi:aspartate/methionine/tyrosine aminotransferase